MNESKYQKGDRAYTLKIETADDIHYWRVSLVAATEMSFDIKIKDYDITLRDICLLVPFLARYDGDLMEAYDNAFRTKPSDHNAKKISLIVSRNEFINVNCGVFASLGFDHN